MNQKESEKFWDKVHEMRLLVLMESEDHKTFHQVELNEAQFKKVSDAIILETKKDPSLRDGYEMACFKLNEDWEIPAEHFDGLASHYEQP